MLTTPGDSGINSIMLWQQLDDRFWFKEKKSGKNVWNEKKVQNNALDAMIKKFTDRIQKKSTIDLKKNLEESSCKILLW